MKRYEIGLIVLALGSGCGLLLEADDVQCNEDSDCTERGFAGAACEQNVCVTATPDSETEPTSTGSTGPTTGEASTTSSAGEDSSSSSGPVVGDGPWDCIGHVEWDEEDENVPAALGLHFTNGQFQDFEGAELNACRPLDLECDEPLSTAVSGPDGVAFAEVYYGFDGYFRAPPPESIPDAYPLIIFANPPPFSVETESRGGDILFIEPTTVAALAAVSGEEIVPDTGFIFFSAFDCNNELAADVTLSVSPVGESTVVTYLDGGFPNPELTETAESGQGAVINVPPGLVEVTATSLDGGKFFEGSVLVEANTITGLAVVPAPM
ncbi:MAG: hypothetical protein ACE37F_30385 [Nannocystaceae bacterium]|nr:hypothetical protein [bacterium]